MYRTNEMAKSIHKWFSGEGSDANIDAILYKNEAADSILAIAELNWNEQDEDWEGIQTCDEIIYDAAKKICAILNSELATEWVITLETDPYHASIWRIYEGKKILKRDGTTPTKWILDNNFGLGYSVEEARRALYTLWNSKCGSCDKSYKYFSNRFDYNVWTYRMERVSDLFIAENNF